MATDSEEKKPAKKPAAKKAAPAKKPAAKKPAAPKASAARSASKKSSGKKVEKSAGETLAYGTGRRKSSTARVWVKKGSGRITVNGCAVETYFARPVLRMIINQPFVAVDRISNYDIDCTVKGGGLSGQAGAVRLGISRALNEVDEAFHTSLRQGGFLTRDSRVVERKKYGHAKARRSFQFSKR